MMMANITFAMIIASVMEMIKIICEPTKTMKQCSHKRLKSHGNHAMVLALPGIPGAQALLFHWLLNVPCLDFLSDTQTFADPLVIDSTRPFPSGSSGSSDPSARNDGTAPWVSYWIPPSIAKLCWQVARPPEARRTPKNRRHATDQHCTEGNRPRLPLLYKNLQALWKPWILCIKHHLKKMAQIAKRYSMWHCFFELDIDKIPSSWLCLTLHFAPSRDQLAAHSSNLM